MDGNAACTIDFLLTTFPPHLWTLLTTSTNDYVQWKGQRVAWKAVTEEEMRAFIGTTVILGLAPLPRLRQCWEQDFVQPKLQATSPRAR